MAEKIKIAGAGLSGLCAAINLKKAGFAVEVYEANKNVGAVKNGDWQGFENWTAKEDVMDRVKECGLETDFEKYPFPEFTFYSYDLQPYYFKSAKPIFYLVRRGSEKGCLDFSLKNQAEALGVEIFTGHSLKKTEADIFAGGGQKPFAVGIGINFDTDLAREGMAILDDKLAAKGYSYFLAVNGRATIVSAFTAKYARNGRKYFENTLDRFKKLKKFSIRNEKKFAGVIYNGLKPEKNQVLTGEAGGFQDYFLGFGMYHAIRSGYLAASALINKKDYRALISRELKPMVKASKLNRFIYERLGNKGYKVFLKQLNKNPDFTASLNKLYTHRFSKLNMLKKLARYV